MACDSRDIIFAIVRCLLQIADRGRRLRAALFLAGAVLACHGQSDGQPLARSAITEATTTVEPSSIAIGHLATLQISVTLPSAPRWVEVDLASLSPAFEVRRVVAGRTFGARRQWSVEITSFEPGTQIVPALTINGEFGDGPSGSLARTAPVDVIVTSPKVSAEDPLQPMAGRLDPPPWPVWLRILLWGVAMVSTAALLSGSIIWSRRAAERRRKTREFWSTTTATMRQLAERARHATPQQRRSLLHSTASLIKSALAAAIDPRVRGRSSTDVRAILSQDSKHAAVRDHSTSILSSLDRQRFGPTPSAKPEGEVLSDAVRLVERLPKRLRTEGPR